MSLGAPSESSVRAASRCSRSHSARGRFSRIAAAISAWASPWASAPSRPADPRASRAAARSSSGIPATAATTWGGWRSPSTARAALTARSPGDRAARRRAITSRASARTGVPDPIAKAQRAGAMGRGLMGKLPDEPRVPVRRVMTSAADVRRGRRRGTPHELRRAGDRQGPQGERLREAAVADQGEQIRRGVGDVGPEGDNDQHRDVAHPSSQVADHLQRRPVGPVSVVDDEHHRRGPVSQRGAQPEDAVRDARRRVRPRHGPAEQEISGLSGRSVQQPSPLALVRIVKRRFQQACGSRRRRSDAPAGRRRRREPGSRHSWRRRSLARRASSSQARPAP